MTIINTWKQSW